MNPILRLLLISALCVCQSAYSADSGTVDLAADTSIGQNEVAIPTGAVEETVEVTPGDVQEVLLSDEFIDSSPAPDGQTFWNMLRERFAVPDLPENLVRPEIAFYTRQHVYTQRMFLRSEKYLYYIFRQTEIRNMPSEAALLPFVESAFKPEAISKSKAVGLWQFLASTGDVYSLERSHWRDDRRDIVESTRAALDYLSKLYAEFNDWQLAFAAYNCGEGTMRRAILANQKKGLPADFSHLSLPNETRHYVPRLLAIKQIVSSPGVYDIVLPEIENEPYFVKISISRDIDLETAAMLSEMPSADFRTLNPSFDRPVALAAHNKTILIPAEKALTFSDNLLTWESSGKALSTWGTHTVRKKETAASIARRFGMTESEFRAANHMSKRAYLKPGAVVLVKSGKSEDISYSSAKAQSAVMEPHARHIFTHVVRKGETFSSIALRYGVSVSSIRTLNKKVSPEHLRVGQRIRISLASGKSSRQKASPKTFRHTVSAGESVFSIAKRYSVSISSIKSNNHLKTFDIYPGQTLLIVQ